MNVTLRTPMTLQTFLAWEERQEGRYEFDGFQPVAMTGGTAAHAAIQRNLIFSLTGRLRGTPCQPYGSELKIEVAGRIRYPDAFIVCTPVEDDATVITAPVVIFEILSDSTKNVDLIGKNAEYRATPSVAHYVILQQDRSAAIVFSRKGEDWVSEVLTSADAVLRLPHVALQIPMAELYSGLAVQGTAEGGNVTQ